MKTIQSLNKYLSYTVFQHSVETGHTSLVNIMITTSMSLSVYQRMNLVKTFISICNAFRGRTKLSMPL
jgi:hypothetical protein